MVEYLVRQLPTDGVDRADSSGKTALAVAAEEGHLDIIRLLTDNKLAGLDCNMTYDL